MPAGLNIKVAGANETLRALNKIEPGLRKQFNAEAQQIMAPAISEASRRYQSIGWGQTKARGVSSQWAGPAVGGRKALPFDPSKAAKGLKTALDSDRRTLNVILLQQRNLGAAILEAAGRKNTNPLGNALGGLSPGTIRTRVIGPAVFATKNQISKKLEDAMLRMFNRVQRELN